MGPRNSLTPMFAVLRTREFPDYQKRSANNLSVDLLISNSHDPSMYSLSIGVVQGRIQDFGQIGRGGG